MWQRYIFKDKNFVKCLSGDNVRSRLRNKIKLDFKETEDWWELVSPQEVIDSVTDIDCAKKQIKDISWIWNFKNLEWLNLWCNQLTALPEEMNNLINLNNLDLSRNNFTIFPKEIENLKNLESLNLCNNKLTILPEGIKNLTKLKYLDLSENYLTVLPREIGDLKNLRKINLKDNQLIDLPIEIWNLENLELFALSKNKLTELPKEIWNLKNLKDLWVGDNNLTTLPVEIKNLKNLKYLDLEWNPKLWNLNRYLKYKDITEYCGKVIDTDGDWINDTCLCIQGNWKYLKLWIEK